MVDLNNYLKLAEDASKKIGWLPEVIFTQWQLETANFTSNNFIKNNNIAGQTWTKNMPIEMRGSNRPKNEGGYYIKYDNPVDGYVDFILTNPRYKNVKNFKNAEEQINEIARSGWATDPNYAEALIKLYKMNLKKGLFNEIPLTIKFGDKGENVKKVQQILGIKDDGIFGPITEKAVKTFQKNHGLLVDGIVGPNTWREM